MKKIEEKELRIGEKRKLELVYRKKRAKKITLTVIALLTIVILSVYIALFISGENPSINKSIQTSLIQTDTEIMVPLSGIGSNAEFYSYDSNGVNIQFFTVRGSDGDIHVAFNACDVCYNAKKGYEQISKVMHCINCGKEFPINSIGIENTAGGCWPSYMPIKINEEYVVIEKTDLTAKKFMFE